MKKLTKIITVSTFVSALFMITSCEREDITPEIQEIETVSENSIDSKIAPSSQEVVLPHRIGPGPSRLSATVIDGNKLEIRRVRPRGGSYYNEFFRQQRLVINGKEIHFRGFRVTREFLVTGTNFFNRISTRKRILSDIKYPDGTPVKQINSFKVIMKYGLVDNPGGSGGARRTVVPRTNVPLSGN